MNTRMPFPYPAVPQNVEYHNGYMPNVSTHNNWNDVRSDQMMNMNGHGPNWDRNNRNNWKRNRNWQPKYNHNTQPYSVPKKQYNAGRFGQQNNYDSYDNGQRNYYEGNGHQGTWIQPHKTKPVKIPEEKESKEQQIPGTVANKKKRKPMSKSYPSNKWDEKDAELALQAEKDFMTNLKSQSLIIRFPDPELTKDIVQQFHSSIKTVHFPQASTPRYCFAHLEENADIDSIVATLEKIPFGQGFLSVDIKKAREENMEVSPKDIDPYTLYVGNLPMNVTKGGVIQQFPTCTRIDIGHPQQMKNTRYAFVRFNNVHDAIACYKTTRSTQYESRSLIVRFRRINGNVGVPGETKQPNAPKTKTEPSNKQVEENIPETATKSSTVSSTVTSSASTLPTAPDLSLVKQEPDSDGEDTNDVKPLFPINGANFNLNIKREIKTESEQPYSFGPAVSLKNEDDVEHPEEEENYVNDSFPYTEGPLEDDCEYEDEDDYDDYDDQAMELDPNETYLPGDDDEDIFSGE